jgi:hypothetical protein
MTLFAEMHAGHTKNNNIYIKGNDMRTSSLKLGLLLAVLGFSVNASAEDRVVDIWNCTVADGKTIADVHAANGKWVKYMNANVEGGDIYSYVLTPIVGKRGVFVYADSYPNLASWTAGQALEGDDLTAINAELDEVADCSENTLHNSKPS